MFWTSVRDAQMLDQAPEHCGFEFRSGFVVNRHGRVSRGFVPSILISGGNCHRFCHIGAQNRAAAGNFGSCGADQAVYRRATRNHQSFDIASLHDCYRFSRPTPLTARLTAGLLPVAGVCGDVPVERFRRRPTSGSATTLRAGSASRSATRTPRAGPPRAGGTCPRAAARPCCVERLSHGSITSTRWIMTAAANGRDRPSCARATRNSPSRAPRTAWRAASTAPAFSRSIPANSEPGPCN